MKRWPITCNISPTGLLTFYYQHNQVRLRSFKSIEAAQRWIVRNDYQVVQTTWEGLS